MTTTTERRGRAADAIRAFVEHPVTNLIVGLILLGTGAAETYQNFTNDLSHWHLRAHHGLLVLGLFNTLASLPNIINGLDAGRKYLEYRTRRGVRPVGVESSPSRGHGS